MKRYRVLQFDYDTRATVLSLKIEEDWEPKVRQLQERNREVIKAGLVQQYGELDADAKIENFVALGAKPLSVLAFHNKFAEQVRSAFVVGGYYPALTGSCSLGERILNHLVRTLRQDFSSSTEFKKVASKDSFDNWNVAIDVLQAWNVLLPDVVANFRDLWKLRWRAVHFDPATDHNDRALALDAIKLLGVIIEAQFGVWGSQPWLLLLPGESYIAKDAEPNPFVRHVYLPNCCLVGPRHTLALHDHQFIVQDEFLYENREIADDEFRVLRGELKRG
ncbi:MAG: hypothetical protein HYR72_16625 [Deltaproteobacteria bacterium]|nr:hypothetical protein [Deltaproteobacteria bacterium]MBI3386774.1 hypothetical protein [Deltaproteobacteria bacterium]